MKPFDVQAKLTEHDELWKRRRPEQERLRDMYETRFFERSIVDGIYNEDQQLEVQTADCFAYVEAMIGQLYAKNPACVVRKGMRSLGDADVCQAVANDWLIRTAREPIENVTRLSLIHPAGWVKLIPREATDTYEAVLPVAIPPWEVGVDYDAPCWEESRFVFHVYWCPVDEAKAKWPGRKWAPIRRKDYFERQDPGAPEQAPTTAPTKFDEYVRIVEFYDFTAPNKDATPGRVYWWSGEHESSKFLGEEAIPARMWNGRRRAPLEPLYLSNMPHRPMEGYSAVRRSHDQFAEKNIVRSFQASAVRKAARQYVTRPGTFDQQNRKAIQAGVDGVILEVSEDYPRDKPLSDAVAPMPHVPMPAETSRYVQEVMADQHMNANSDPFSRGQGLGGRASAAEVAALVSYSAGPLGLAARKRDGLIERLVTLYLATMAYLVDDSTSPVIVDGISRIPTPDDLLGDFRVFAEDEGQTPVSEAMRSQQFFINAPTLQALGASREWLLQQAAKMLGYEDIPTEPPAQPPGGAMGPMSTGAAPPSMMEAISNPSPENIEATLAEV